MVGLYFLYLIGLQSMVAMRADDVRIVPFALMGWMLHPPLNAVLGLLLQGARTGVPLDPESSNFYTRVDAWFYVAIAVTCLLSWLLFDRRRESLMNRLGDLSGTPVFRHRFLILALQLAFTIFLNRLGHRGEWHCLAAFAIAIAILSGVARFCTRQQPGLR